MRTTLLALLVGVVIGLAQAALLPIRQAATSCQPLTVHIITSIINTVTVTQVVTDAPPTVTVLQEDPNSVASYMASVDTIQILESSQLRPISNTPDTVIPVFTHSVLVSGFEATELANDGTSAFYMPKSDTVSPSRTIVAEVTTVTVDLNNKPTTGAGLNVGASSPGPSAFESPVEGWNGTDSNSSAWALGTGSGLAYPTGGTLTVTNIVTTVTQSLTVSVTAAPTSADVPSDYGYVDPESSSAVDVVKRQTCVWITATINGQEVGWCNNWGGRSTLTYTSWETTITPTYIPGIGTIATSHSSQDSTTSESTVPTSTTLGPTSSASSCGEVGPYQIGFDDLPQNEAFDNNTAPFPPIFNPYEHLYWGDGWAYVPPPNDPFPPQAGVHLAQFIPSLNNTVAGSPNAGLIPRSSFGCGPRNFDNRYWFNVYSAWVGCDNGATNLSISCDFVASAYQWDGQTDTEVLVSTQHFRIPPCPNFNKCQLTKINFNYLFHKLTTISFYANVQGKVSQFWIDSISMDWYNNTCSAGLARISSRKARE